MSAPIGPHLSIDSYAAFRFHNHQKTKRRNKAAYIVFEKENSNTNGMYCKWQILQTSSTKSKADRHDEAVTRIPGVIEEAAVPEAVLPSG